MDNSRRFVRFVAGANTLRQIETAALWEAKAHELAVKHGAYMVHDEIIFDKPANARAFRQELEHWWEALRGHNVGTQVSRVQGAVTEATPTDEAGDL